MSPELAVVHEWHIALNNDKVDELVKLVDQDVTVGGPRGSTQGRDVVREWFGRANVHLLPLRSFHRDNAVVVEEQGEWLSPETGEVTGRQIVATAFTVKEGLITSIVRYDDLQTALQNAGLTLLDEIQGE